MYGDMSSCPLLEHFFAGQDEASRSKVGLTAGKMELDARLYIADILGPALAANHKLGLAAGLLQVHISMQTHTPVSSLVEGTKEVSVVSNEEGWRSENFTRKGCKNWACFCHMWVPHKFHLADLCRRCRLQ